MPVGSRLSPGRDGTTRVRREPSDTAASVPEALGAGGGGAMLCWLMVAGSLGAQAEPTERPILPADTRMETLENGLKVVVVPLNTPGLVSVQTWMDVGARDEVVPGTTGYAHFFEHLMFHGSRALPRADRERALRGSPSMRTPGRITPSTTRWPPPSLTRLLEIEGDRFARLHLQPAAVKREAGAVRARKGQASPGDAVWTGLMDAAFRVHTYGHPVIGLDEDVAGMPDGFEQVASFLDEHYRPERATLVVAGDVDPGEVFATVGRTHGSWTRDGGRLGAPLFRSSPSRPPSSGPCPLDARGDQPEAAHRLEDPGLHARLDGQRRPAARRGPAGGGGLAASPSPRRRGAARPRALGATARPPLARRPAGLGDPQPRRRHRVRGGNHRRGGRVLGCGAVGRGRRGGPRPAEAGPRGGARPPSAAALAGLPRGLGQRGGALRVLPGQPRDLGLHARALGAVTPGAVRDVAERFLQEERMTVAVLASRSASRAPGAAAAAFAGRLTGEPRP